MRKIFKYTLELIAEGKLATYVGFRPLCVQMQNGQICCWAEVDDSRPKGEAKVTIVGTGHEVPPNAGQYVGTVQQGMFVWHIYMQEAV